MRVAVEADAVICIAAHRHGYVPPPDLGGDGERSVDAAKRGGKRVFAFLVDTSAPWTGVKEQDRLTIEPQEKFPEIIEAVQKSNEFKAYLERESTWNTFSTPEDLAKLVAVTLAKFSSQSGFALRGEAVLRRCQPADR